MISPEQVIAKLNEWRTCDYFAESRWEERGLIPSGAEVQKALDTAKNSMVDGMLGAIKAKADEEEMILLALNHFRVCLDSRSFDTEESEFLADCIAEVANSIELEDFYGRSEKLMMERHNL